MEQNTNRMWWTIGAVLLGGILIAGFLLIANNNFTPKISEKMNALIKQTDPDVTHTAYSWSSDGTDRFTATKPNLNLLGGTSQNISIQGLNQENQCSSSTNQMYYFANGQNLFQQNIGTNNKVTLSFDWIATNPTSGVFFPQYNQIPWQSQIASSIAITSTNSSGHVVMSFSSSAEENTSTAIATGVELRLDNIPTNTNITISNFKYELSQPKYIGTYTDKNESDSQKPSDYTWKLNPDYHV